jgi:hypothetical protein
MNLRRAGPVILASLLAYDGGCSSRDAVDARDSGEDSPGADVGAADEAEDASAVHYVD